MKILRTLACILLISLGLSSPVLASVGFTATKQFTMTVAAQLTITTTTPLPAAMVGQTYSVTFAATGGVGSYTWSVASGSTLPAGLTLSLGGVLSGTPTTAGSYTFSITVTDGSGATASAQISNKN